MHLDGSEEKWPTIVFFEEPRSFSKKAETKRYTQIELTLYDNDKEIKMSNFTENELKDKFAQLTSPTNDEKRVSLKIDPGASSEEVTRIKELLRMLYKP